MIDNTRELQAPNQRPSLYVYRSLPLDEETVVRQTCAAIDTMTKELNRNQMFRILWRAALLVTVLFLVIRIGMSFIDVPTIPQAAAQPEPGGPKYGCKHFYFNIGVGNGQSIEEFINGTRWSTDRPTRAMVGYRVKNELMVDEFCIFAFEPNLAFSDTLHRMVRKLKSSVRYLHVFTGTVPGPQDSVIQVNFNKSSGKLLSWGDAQDAPDVITSQAQMLDLAKFMNDAFGETGPRGRVLMRVDLEGAEVLIVRDILPIICKHVLKLEIEYHESRFGKKGICAQWMLHFLFSSPTCRPRWKRPEEIPEQCDIWSISQTFGG
jgi:hypothetical protein